MIRYATASAFRRALEQRLLDHARLAGSSYPRLRKLLMFERLLARLVIAAPDRWILKGALALDFRLGDRSRATKDMDLMRHDNEAAMSADFVAASALDLGDFMTFDIKKVSAPVGGLEFLSRYHVGVELAGRTFEQAVVDVSFVDPLRWPPELILAPDLLSFANIPPIRVPILTGEQHVAEKLRGYTQMHSGGRPSSRVKDLIDLVLIKRSIDLDAAKLHAALTGVFANREEQPLPATLPPPPVGWPVPYGKLAREVGLDPSLILGHAEAALLIDPVLAGLRSGRWDRSRSLWAL